MFGGLNFCLTTFLYLSHTIQDTAVEGTTCSTPSIVLPENAVTPDTEIDKNLVNRYCIIHHESIHKFQGLCF